MFKYTNIDPLLAKYDERLKNLRSEYIKGLCEVLVMASPVDTGAYVASHSVASTIKAPGYKSKVQPFEVRKQPKGPTLEAALARLESEVDALPEDYDKVYIVNNAPHNKIVENGGGRNWKVGAFKPFGIMRRNAKNVLEATKNRLIGEN